jgi:hypothetical protein
LVTGSVVELTADWAVLVTGLDALETGLDALLAWLAAFVSGVAASVTGLTAFVTGAVAAGPTVDAGAVTAEVIPESAAGWSSVAA